MFNIPSKLIKTEFLILNFSGKVNPFPCLESPTDKKTNKNPHKRKFVSGDFYFTKNN